MTKDIRLSTSQLAQLFFLLAYQLFAIRLIMDS